MFIERAVIALLDHGCTIEAASCLYESAPVGPVLDQPSFLNAVVLVSCQQNPAELLEICQTIENRMGRQRDINKGPRTIDLDLLLAGALVQTGERLTLPHPELTHRSFVLVPLLEIDADLRDPRDGAHLAPRAAEVARLQPLRRVGSLHHLVSSKAVFGVG
jgi:2-amino-4-hydroxy-6-hydroxymethyldihydropteridine diphosphokinase